MPGLIAVIHDTKDNYTFTLNGLEDHLNYFAPVYFTPKETLSVKGTREKIRATIRSVYGNPTETMLQDPMIKIDAKTAKSMDKSQDPYNPIELE